MSNNEIYLLQSVLIVLLLFMFARDAADTCCSFFFSSAPRYWKKYTGIQSFNLVTCGETLQVVFKSIHKLRHGKEEWHEDLWNLIREEERKIWSILTLLPWCGSFND